MEGFHLPALNARRRFTKSSTSRWLSRSRGQGHSKFRASQRSWMSVSTSPTQTGRSPPGTSGSTDSTGVSPCARSSSRARCHSASIWRSSRDLELSMNSKSQAKARSSLRRRACRLRASNCARHVSASRVRSEESCRAGGRKSGSSPSTASGSSQTSSAHRLSHWPSPRAAQRTASMRMAPRQASDSSRVLRVSRVLTSGRAASH
mmetsp:Transcript_32088/g.72158  ORF Transcript_32088/g.72158 Transcript_32088/m.72158 type:complete len:205 (+) Transcript_32088:815-1429(+)